MLERVLSEKATAAPILVLHGLIAEADSFRALMAVLPGNRRVVALDLPGAGYSERSQTRDVSFGGLAKTVCAAARELDLEGTVLLGHSHGGTLALRLATVYPEFARALVLMCPAHPFGGYDTRLVRFYLTRPGRAFAHSLPRLPDWMHLLALRQMPGKRRALTRVELQPYLHTLRFPGTIAHLLALLGTWETDMAQLREDLQRTTLSTPALVLWGDQDPVVPLSTAAALLANIQDCELVTLEGVGHLPNEEAPGECGALIASWLERRRLV